VIRFRHQMGVLRLASWGSFPLPRLPYQESDIGLLHPHVCNGGVVSIVLLLLSGCRGYLWYEKAKSTLARLRSAGAVARTIDFSPVFFFLFFPWGGPST